MHNLVKTLNWNLYGRVGFDKKFTLMMRHSMQETGFFVLRNHNIPFSLLAENRNLFEIFLKDLALEQRMEYIFAEDAYQRGYTPIHIETGEFAKIPDNKHFYQLGDMYDNPYVAEVPKLKQASAELFDEFYKLYKELMRVVAMTLDLDKHFFDDQLGNSFMRHIHYPKSDNPVADDSEVQEGGNILGMCASKHTDINDLTLLHATEPGLQLQHNGNWIPITCDEHMIIINVGDMLKHLTGGMYRSGIHRVVCEPGIERFSSPFFGHRKDECSVIPIANLDSDLSQFPFKNEGEYLNYRLKQIGLK